MSKSLLLDLPCEFGGVSIGDKTASVGLTFSRESIALEPAVSTLCGRQLTGRIFTCAEGEDLRQMQLINERSIIETVFEGVGPKRLERIKEALEAFWRENPQYAESVS